MAFDVAAARAAGYTDAEIAKHLAKQDNYDLSGAKKNGYLNTRFDVLFSIYLLFSVAVIARHLWSLGQLLRGRDPGVAPPDQTSSPL